MIIDMDAVLTSDAAKIDWDRLASIFRRAPLGDREVHVSIGAGRTALKYFFPLTSDGTHANSHRHPM